ncbi:MAG: Lrp/AsnC family transcriptional regulator [Promethearchaeota archaeon]
MAPNESEISSADHDIFLNEIDNISKFLKVSPVKEITDEQRYITLDKRERLMALFLDYFLPKSVFPEIIAEDLAYLTAYNLVDVTEKEILASAWYEKRSLTPARTDKPLMRFEDGTMYRSVHDLLEADSFTFGEFLPLLLKKVQRLRKFIREPLTAREATRYLDNIWMGWRPKLSKNDLKVVLYLDSSPNRVFSKKKEIAEALDLHENSITYILDRLQKLFRLRVLGRPNLNKLGLQTVLVITEDRVHIEFPYLTAIQELRAGNVVMLHPFNIPRQRGKIHPFRDLHNVMKDELDTFVMYKTLEIQDHLSFQHFDEDENTWDIDWDAWALWLERILYEDKYYVVSPDSVKFIDGAEKSMLFDSKDLEILDYYGTNLRMPMSRLGQLVGMTRAGVRRRVKRLRNENALIPFVNLMQIGLDEQIVVLYTGDEEYLNPFQSALSELPVMHSYTLNSFTNDSKASKKCLLAWLRLPSGSFIKFTDAVTNVLRESDAIWTAHRYQFRSSAKLLPMKMFDADKKEWRWDNDVLAQLTIEK